MIPLSIFADSFSIGNIYWFKNPQIGSTDPHPHLCIGIKNDQCVFLICGTSQFAKKQRYFELNGLPFETLVRIQPNNDNSLDRDTYINCNDVQTHNLNDLFTTDSFSFYGTITDSELFQVRNGLEISELLEEETKNIILKDFPSF